MLRIIHHLAGKSGETCGRGFRVEHHLCRHQLSAQAGVHHLLPQQQGQHCHNHLVKKKNPTINQESSENKLMGV